MIRLLHTPLLLILLTDYRVEINTLYNIVVNNGSNKNIIVHKTKEI